MNNRWLFLPVLLLCFQLRAQDDFEFQKGFSNFLNIHSGLISAPQADLYVGGIQLVPQFTVIEHKLKIGASVGGVYTAKKVQGLFGLNTSIKLKSLVLSEAFTASANVNLMLRHQWGTRSQKLLGAGIQFEVLDWFGMNLFIDRDYHFDNWWYNVGIAYQLHTKKESTPTFNH